MGLFTKKSSSKSTTNQTTNLTTTPTNPDFVSNGLADLGGRVTDTFKNLDPYSLVAGPDALQTQAAGAAANLGNATQGAFRRVMSAGPQTVQAANIADYIPGLMSPFVKQVKDTSLADFDFGAGQQMGQANLDLGQDTTFGGSAGALYKRGLADDIIRGRGALSAQISSEGFDKAAALAAQQAGLTQGANLANADFGEQALSRKLAGATAPGADQRANVDTQSQIGEALRQIEAAKRMAPISALGAEGAIWSGIPLDLLHGSNATGSLNGTTTTKGKTSGATLGDWLDFFKANAAAAAGAG
jgi:hypothetical protein